MNVKSEAKNEFVNMIHSFTFGICYKVTGRSEKKKIIIVMMFVSCFLDGFF